jgi:hypothetical protein
MTARIAFALMFAATAASPQGVEQIIRRIQELALKEPVSLGIETEMRAAYLLRESHPVPARAFLERAKRRLAAYPEIIPTKWMINSLFTFEPDQAEDLILEQAKRETFRVLIEHYFSRDQPENVTRILYKVIADDGPAFEYVGNAPERLMSLEPLAATNIYLTLRNTPTLKSKYITVVSGAPLFYSQALGRAAVKDKAAVRMVLGRLLPLFDDKAFLTDVKVSMKVQLGNEDVQTKNARETALLRMGALSKAIAPDVYERYDSLFDGRLLTVQNLEDAQPILTARAQRNAPQKPGFDFQNAPVESALAAKRPTLATDLVLWVS